uniref:Gag-pol polyprotein n=1 Tax=Solanum tuberosum TaxID=4113 RepID=M1DCX7_SOLTU
MVMTPEEKAELASYQLKDVAHVCLAISFFVPHFSAIAALNITLELMVLTTTLSSSSATTLSTETTSASISSGI